MVIGRAGRNSRKYAFRLFSAGDFHGAGFARAATHAAQSYSVQRSPTPVHRTRFRDALARAAVFVAFAAFAWETSRMSRRQPTACP